MNLASLSERLRAGAYQAAYAYPHKDRVPRPARAGRSRRAVARRRSLQNFVRLRISLSAPIAAASAICSHLRAPDVAANGTWSRRSVGSSSSATLVPSSDDAKQGFASAEHRAAGPDQRVPLRASRAPAQLRTRVGGASSRYSRRWAPRAFPPASGVWPENRDARPARRVCRGAPASIAIS